MRIYSRSLVGMRTESENQMITPCSVERSCLVQWIMHFYRYKWFSGIKIRVRACLCVCETINYFDHVTERPFTGPRERRKERCSKLSPPHHLSVTGFAPWVGLFRLRSHDCVSGRSDRTGAVRWLGAGSVSSRTEPSFRSRGVSS